jgi:carbamoyl-phosphate synthase large subunit
MQNEYPTVRQANLTDMRSSIKDWPLPLLVKPRFGSASLGVKILGSSNELLCVLNGDTSDLIVQEIADGREYTVNVFVNREGKCLATVPHRRLAVRAGEVSKALTVKNKNLMELARKISETLPGAYGPMNIQVFLDDIGQAKVIEINPRFGGGFPVAYEAGADFPAWLIMECLGEERKVYYDDWRDKLLMLRYDEAVFISDSRIWEEEP